MRQLKIEVVEMVERRKGRREIDAWGCNKLNPKQQCSNRNMEFDV